MYKTFRKPPAVLVTLFSSPWPQLHPFLFLAWTNPGLVNTYINAILARRSWGSSWSRRAARPWSLRSKKERWGLASDIQHMEMSWMIHRQKAGCWRDKGEISGSQYGAAAKGILHLVVHSSKHTNPEFGTVTFSSTVYRSFSEMSSDFKRRSTSGPHSKALHTTVSHPSRACRMSPLSFWRTHFGSRPYVLKQALPPKIQTLP